MNQLRGKLGVFFGIAGAFFQRDARGIDAELGHQFPGLLGFGQSSEISEPVPPVKMTRAFGNRFARSTASVTRSP